MRSESCSFIWHPKVRTKNFPGTAKRIGGGRSRGRPSGAIRLGGMKIGAHVSTAGGIATGIGRGEEIACEAIQIFTQSPRMWRPTNYSDEALDGYAASRGSEPDRRHVLPCDLPHQLGDRQRGARREELRLPREQPRRRHPHRFQGRRAPRRQPPRRRLRDGGDPGRRGLREGLRRGRGEPAAAIVPTADRERGRNRRNGRAQLRGDRGADRRHRRRRRLGVCIDTQHLFASGISYSTRAEADAVVSSFDATIGLDRLGCLHLNDSKVPLGSNRDRHENLGDGEVGATALGWLLSHPGARRAFQRSSRCPAMATDHDRVTSSRLERSSPRA